MAGYLFHKQMHIHISFPNIHVHSQNTLRPHNTERVHNLQNALCLNTPSAYAQMKHTHTHAHAHFYFKISFIHTFGYSYLFASVIIH